MDLLKLRSNIRHFDTIYESIGCRWPGCWSKRPAHSQSNTIASSPAATTAVSAHRNRSGRPERDWGDDSTHRRLRGARLQTAAIQSPLSAQEFQLLKLANDSRVQAGLAPLQFSQHLMLAARNHSRDMAAHGYLGHDSPTGDTPADRARAAGIDYDELGENVYRGVAPDADALPERVIKAWLQNRAHRANLLSPGFRLSAVGIARADDGNYFVTQDFIR